MDSEYGRYSLLTNLDGLGECTVPLESCILSLVVLERSLVDQESGVLSGCDQWIRRHSIARIPGTSFKTGWEWDSTYSRYLPAGSMFNGHTPCPTPMIHVGRNDSPQAQISQQSPPYLAPHQCPISSISLTNHEYRSTDAAGDVPA